MKSCPKCNLDYSDDTLEFCLEDGTKLVFQNENQTERPTVVRQQFQTDSITAKTANLPFTNQPQNLEQPENEKAPLNTPPVGILKNEVLSKGANFLETAPIVVSLAHNWWQWIYLNNQYYYSFWSYILSANFLMWMLLLVAGVVVGLISLKKSSNKGFAIVSLVILAINLLLYLVPKR